MNYHESMKAKAQEREERESALSWAVHDAIPLVRSLTATNAQIDYLKGADKADIAEALEDYLHDWLKPEIAVLADEAGISYDDLVRDTLAEIARNHFRTVEVMQ